MAAVRGRISPVGTAAVLSLTAASSHSLFAFSGLAPAVQRVRVASFAPFLVSLLSSESALGRETAVVLHRRLTLAALAKQAFASFVDMIHLGMRGAVLRVREGIVIARVGEGLR